MGERRGEFAAEAQFSAASSLIKLEDCSAIGILLSLRESRVPSFLIAFFNVLFFSSFRSIILHAEGIKG